VCVLVDNREIKQSANRNIFCKLRERNICCERRTLPLGDILWLAVRSPLHSNHHTDHNTSDNEHNTEDEVENTVVNYHSTIISQQQQQHSISKSHVSCEQRHFSSIESSEESDSEVQSFSTRTRTRTDTTPNEIVMNYILERKRISDLRQSLIDGRYTHSHTFVRFVLIF
jgi:ERCC4-type nuclease